MSALYTQCSGQARTTASRRGSKNSGVRASVQSWEFSLISCLNYKSDDKLDLRLIAHNDSSGYYGDTIYDGDPFKLRKLLELVREVGTDNTIKILERKTKALNKK